MIRNVFFLQHLQILSNGHQVGMLLSSSQSEYRDKDGILIRTQRSRSGLSELQMEHKSNFGGRLDEMTDGKDNEFNSFTALVKVLRTKTAA